MASMNLEMLKFRFLEMLTLVHLVLQTRSVFRFWWLQRRGRQAELDALLRRMSLAWARRIFSRVHCRVEVEGLEHVPAEGPLVIMTNHQSMYDIPLLVGYLSRPAGFLTKKELFRIPGLSFWMRRMHCAALDRSDAGAGGRLYRRLAEDLQREGRAFIVFPEGTRTRAPDGAIQAFKPGSVRLATDYGIPVLPVSLDGTRFFHDAEAVGRTRRGGRLVRLRIAPPVYPGRMNAPQRRAFVEHLRATIVSNHERIRVQWRPGLADPQQAPQPSGG